MATKAVATSFLAFISVVAPKLDVMRFLVEGR
jgi:hypothetical protein